MTQCYSLDSRVANSGNLKSGDSFFCITLLQPEHQRPTPLPPTSPPPPPPPPPPGDLVTRTGDREIVVVSGRASGMYADRSVCLMSFVQLARKRSIWGRLLRESSTRKENASRLSFV